MYRNILNFIISFSIVGLIFVFANDYFFAPKTERKTAVNLTPTIKLMATINPAKIDPLVNCNSKYFNFQKGTSWRYKMYSTIDIKDKDKTAPKNYQYYFTNTVIKASGTSAVIETMFDNDEDEKIQTTLTCKKSGIYGLPLPLTGPESPRPSVDKSRELFKLGKIGKNVLFIPADNKLKPGESWQSIISIETGLPILSNLNISIKNKIAGQRVKTTKEKITKTILDVESKIVDFDLPTNSIKLPQGNIFTYSLEENTGVLNYILDFKVEEFGSIASSMELIDFRPARNASLQ